MANLKITELTALTTVDGSDVLPVVDVSTSTTKKVTKDDLFKAVNMIGIGVSSPIFPLDVNSGTLDVAARFASADANCFLDFRDNATTAGYVRVGAVGNDFVAWSGNAERMRIDSVGVVLPGSDNAQTLGSASYRWSVVYAGTGTINTSDEREKQQIANLDDAERRVAVAIKGLVKKFKYNDAVTAKGDDARIHVGVIAQEVVAAFAAEGLDATRYALLCYDEWDAEPEQVDKEGNVVQAAREAGNQYGIRYDELLAFIIAAL
jgi:hypothetical protein